MTGIFTAKATPGKPRCARCHRPFTPKKPDQKYGDKCARKMLSQQTLSIERVLEHVDTTDRT